MVTCEDFYEKFRRKGNFCNKSEVTAKAIEAYIDYRDKYKLASFEINRCALSPFIAIEDKEIVHRRAIQELKRECKRIGGKNITRRLSIEIINRVNDRVDECYRLKSIPGHRSRMDGLQHEIGSVSFDVRNSFDNIKSEIGIHNNNDFMSAMINFCSSHKVEMFEIKEMMEKAKEAEAIEPDGEDTEKIELVKNV